MRLKARMEKDQLPSSLMDRFLLRINEWIEELRMKGVWSILDYLSSTIDQVIQYSLFVGLGRCSWYGFWLIRCYDVPVSVCTSFSHAFRWSTTNKSQCSILLHYSYRLDGVKLSGGNFFVSIKNASTAFIHFSVWVEPWPANYGTRWFDRTF